MFQRTYRAMAACGLASLVLLGIAGCGGSHRIVPGSPEPNDNGGLLPQNVIFYTDSPAGNGIDVRYINPNGTGDTLYASLPATFLGFTVNARTGDKFFGYMPTDGSSFGVYRNSTASPEGAAVLVPPTYDFISNLQISPDGQTLYYVAAAPEQPAQLYRVSVSGGGAPVALDDAEAVSLSPAGDRLVYSKVVGEVTELFTRGTGADDTPVQITNTGREHLYPAWNRQGTSIAFASDAEDGSLDLYTVDASGGSLRQITNTPGVAELSPSFNESGDRLAFAAIASDIEQSGIYTSGTGGADVDRQLVKADPSILEWTYWSTANGRSRSPQSVLNALRSRRH